MRLLPAHADSPLLRTSSSTPTDVTLTPGGGSELRYYLSVCVKRRWLIIGVVLTVTTSAALYVLSLPNIYESSAVLRLQQQGSSFPGEQASPNSFEAYQYFKTQVELLTNPHLIRRAAIQHRLYLNPRLFGDDSGGEWQSRFRKLVGGEGAARASLAEDALAPASPDDPEALTPQQAASLEPYVSHIQRGLVAHPQEDTSLLTVSFRHTDPETAAQVTTAVTETFISDNVKFETAGTQSALNLLGKQIAEIQISIQQFERQRIKFLRENHLPLGEGQGRNLTSERVGLLSSQLLAAEDERKRLEADLEAARAAPDTWSVPQVAASKPVQEGRARLRELGKRRQALLQTYTEEWPEVKTVNAEIRQLETEVGAAAREAIGGLEAGYEAALARERKLRSAYERENNAANGQSRSSMELTSIELQIEMSRQLYSLLFQSQKKLEISSIDRGHSVGLVSPAIPPRVPVAPSRWAKFGLAFLLSLVTGIALALLFERLNSKLSSVADVTTHLALQTLGMIPFDRPQSVAGLRQGEQGGSLLRLMADSFSPTAEAYRNLRASLLFAAHDLKPQIILITSSQQFEGKTTTAVNLACAFVQAGAETLLVDCDLRRPSVHRHFGLRNESGVTDYLTGRADFDQLLLPSRDYPLLKVMTAGTMPTNPSDYLDSAEMRDLLEQMRKRFAYIIIDSPPALPFADAPLLSTMADATLIVVNTRRTNRLMVKRVKERLVELGSPVFGVVLNYTELREKDTYYYYRKEASPTEGGAGGSS